MTKKEFASYIDNMLIRHEVSEAKLANAVGIGQKSINRYRNGITLPDEEKQNRIKSYFEHVEKDGLKPGERYVSPEDFIEQQIYKDMEELWDIEDMLEAGKACTYSDKLKFYTPKAQEFILKYFDMFALTEDYEMEFLNCIHKLSENDEQKVRVRMENVPVSLDMLVAGNLDEMDIQEPYFKLKLYLDFLRDTEPWPTKIHTTVDENTGEPKMVVRKENMAKFEADCIDYYHATGNWIGLDFFQKVNKLLSYKVKDWYYLYLFNRIRLLDMSDLFPNRYRIEERHYCGENEASLWDYLDLLAGVRHQ